MRQETFNYDNRNRLTDYTCLGSEPINDAKGNSIASQIFNYDVYSNITSVQSYYTNNESDLMVCIYGNSSDPCQLQQVMHTHKSYYLYNNGGIILQYDDIGCLTNDGENTFNYDNILNPGYLISTERKSIKGRQGANSNYYYDAFCRLIKQDNTSFCYRGDTLVNQLLSNNNVRLFTMGIGNVAQVRSDGNKNGVWLTGAEASGSVLSVEQNGNQENMAYSPYGEQPANDSATSLLGYNGERLDSVPGGYHLGNGYRLYNPALQRFTSPDSLSPFGAGGINAYAYCDGDPINNTDPSGHRFHPFRALLKADRTIKKHIDKTVDKVLGPVVKVANSKVGRIVQTVVQVAVDVEDPAVGAEEAADAGARALEHSAETAAKDVGEETATITGSFSGDAAPLSNDAPAPNNSASSKPRGRERSSSLSALDDFADYQPFDSKQPNNYDHLYRGDTRPPDEIKQGNGFTGKQFNEDLRTHAQGVPYATNAPKDSAYISTSKDVKVTKTFAKKEGFIYQIDKSGGNTSLDVNAKLGRFTPTPVESEVAIKNYVPWSSVERSIPVSDVASSREVSELIEDRGYKHKFGRWARNRDYRPRLKRSNSF